MPKDLEQLLSLVTRSVPVKPSSYDEKTRSVEVVLASEQPVLVWDRERWEIVREVLFMDGVVIPDDGQAPLVDTHDRSTIFNQLGSVRDCKVQDNQLVGRLYFDSTEEGTKAETKVKEGHLRTVSIGYQQIETHWVPVGQSRTFPGKGEFAGPIRITPRSALGEVSLTIVPADKSAKTRTIVMTADLRTELNSRGLPANASDEEALTFLRQELTKTKQPSIHGGGNMKTKEELDAERKEREEAERQSQEARERAEKERKEEIEATGKKFGPRIRGGQAVMDQLVRDAIELKRSVELFRGDIFTRVSDSEPLEQPDSFLGLGRKDVERYSVRKACLSLLKQRGLNLRQEFGKEIDTKLEDECSNELAKRFADTHRGGMAIPFEVQTRGMIPMTKRDQTVGTPSEGGALVGTNLMSFIDYLRARPVATKAGVNQLFGLVGDVAFPRQTSDPEFYYVAEGAPPASESAAAFDQVTMTPKTGAAYVDFTRKLLLQSTPSIDGIIMRSLGKKGVLGVDKACFHGSGGTQPTGIAGTAGIGSVDCTGLNRPGVLEFESDVRGANAEQESMVFALNPVDLGTLKGRPETLNYPKYVASDDDKILNYPALYTNQINAGYVFFGGFSEAALGFWGGLEIALDDKTQLTSGIYRFVMFVSFDFAVFHPGAFSVGSNLT